MGARRRGIGPICIQSIPIRIERVQACSVSLPWRFGTLLIDRERIYTDRDDLTPIFRAGGKVYICGSPALAEGVKNTMVRIWCERKGQSEEAGWKWLQGLGKERFATDIFV